MKIAFIGTHGVGKTTLCYELAALLKKQGLAVELVMEVARSCPLPINRETGLLSQLWILHTQIIREIEVEARHPLVVCDRSVLDNYAYLFRAVGAHPPAERIVDDWLSTYSVLFRVPRSGRPQTDGVRDTDLEFQTAIDELLLSLLAQKKVPYHDLAGLPRNRWIHVALQTVMAARRGETRIEPAAPETSQLDLFSRDDLERRVD